jgi:hypothetical protein
MDLYLEHPAFWPDFHPTFVNYWREAIADALPASYSARLGERVYLVEQPAGERKLVSADVTVTHGERSSSAPGGTRQGVATLEPVTIPAKILEEVREPYIEILHRPDRALVAILEMLSPANKELPGRDQYLAKRNRALRQDLHLVELDLLLKGQRPPLAQALPPGDYYYLLARADQRPNYQVYAWTMRDPLPTLPVPLRPPDPDIHIDLGAVFATAYQRGRYQSDLDYSAAPPVALTREQGDWVKALLGHAPA